MKIFKELMDNKWDYRPPEYWLYPSQHRGGFYWIFPLPILHGSKRIRRFDDRPPRETFEEESRRARTHFSSIIYFGFRWKSYLRYLQEALFLWKRTAEPYVRSLILVMGEFCTLKMIGPHPLRLSLRATLSSEHFLWYNFLKFLVCPANHVFTLFYFYRLLFDKVLMFSIYTFRLRYLLRLRTMK